MSRSVQVKEVHPFLRPMELQASTSEDPTLLKARLHALTKKYAWEILADLHDGAKNLTQLADDNGLPYTSVQNRVAELEHAKLVRVVDYIDGSTGRPVKRVVADDFTLTLTLEKIADLTRRAKGSKPGFLK